MRLELHVLVISSYSSGIILDKAKNRTSVIFTKEKSVSYSVIRVFMSDCSKLTP